MGNKGSSVQQNKLVCSIEDPFVCIDVWSTIYQKCDWRTRLALMRTCKKLRQFLEKCSVLWRVEFVTVRVQSTLQRRTTPEDLALFQAIALKYPEGIIFCSGESERQAIVKALCRKHNLRHHATDTRGELVFSDCPSTAKHINGVEYRLEEYAQEEFWITKSPRGAERNSVVMNTFVRFLKGSRVVTGTYRVFKALLLLDEESRFIWWHDRIRFLDRM